MRRLRAWWRRNRTEYGKHSAPAGVPTPLRPVRGHALLRRAR